MSERKRSLSGGSVSDDQLDLWWGEFLEEGDELFEHMTKNFESMLSGDTIKHLNMFIGTGFTEYECYEKIMLEIDLIEKTLITWINQEHIAGRLFNKDLWKPFRDLQYLHDMHLGYKKMFKYGQYIFQLGLQRDCYAECKLCMGYIHNVHFCLALYSGSEEDSSHLKIWEDDMLHGRFWKCR